MAFVSECAVGGGWTGTHETGINKYTVTRKVRTDDRQDGVKVVTDGLAGAGLVVGTTTYAHGNDTDAASILLRMRPERQGDLDWLVRLEYGDPRDQTEDTKPDDNGNETSNPYDWRTEIAGFSYAYSKPIRNAFAVENPPEPLNAWQHKHPGAAGDRWSIENSAGQNFDPPPVEEVSLFGYRYTRYTQQWDETLNAGAVGTVNENSVTLNNNTGVINQLAWKQHTIWFSRLEPSLERINQLDVWVLVYEIICNELTWLESIPDRGWVVNADAGDAKQNDQSGNTWSGGEIAAHRDNVQNAVDQNGEAVLDQVRLDGSGLVLGHNLQTRTVTYRYKGEFALETLPIPIYAVPP